MLRAARTWTIAGAGLQEFCRHQSVSCGHRSLYSLNGSQSFAAMTSDLRASLRQDWLRYWSQALRQVSAAAELRSSSALPISPVAAVGMIAFAGGILETPTSGGAASFFQGRMCPLLCHPPSVYVVSCGRPSSTGHRFCRVSVLSLSSAEAPAQTPEDRGRGCPYCTSTEALERREHRPEHQRSTPIVAQ
ncbi:hypothetical protein BV20DRAFT_812930 [Pilatotrama ljubarskyi]|nr:hypothetical protein BV20DRAFT_812930 [Pilatotrama ljubarskyi]